MYNPEYCSRPHVVVLNKMDLPEASSQCERVMSELLHQAADYCEQWKHEGVVPTAPVAIVTASATTGRWL